MIFSYTWMNSGWKSNIRLSQGKIPTDLLHLTELAVTYYQLRSIRQEPQAIDQMYMDIMSYLSLYFHFLDI